MPKGKMLMGKTPKPVPGGRGRGRGPIVGKPVKPKPMGMANPGKVTLPKRGPGVGKPKPVQPSPRGGGFTNGSNDRNKKATAKPAPRRPGNATPKGRGASSQLLSNGVGGTRFPSGMDWAGSPTRPQLDKMSPTGTTTNTLDWTERKRQDLYRGAELANAGRAYAKNVGSEIKRKQNVDALRTNKNFGPGYKRGGK